MLKQTINPDQIISSGTQLSPNFIMGHVSTGAYHYLLGKIMPKFTSFLKPGSSPLPTWKVASNLQMGAQTILEKFLTEFGSDLIIQSGFMGQINSALGLVDDIQNIINDPAELLNNPLLSSSLQKSLGQSFEIQVRGFEKNMYGVSKTIQNLSKAASNLELIYGNSSFMRINFDENSVASRFTNNAIKSITTKDLINNVMEAGLTSIRGL